MTPPLLDQAPELAARESGLAVVVASRADGSAQASVVNAGVLEHPLSGEPIVGFVVRGAARKLVLLRVRPRVTVVFRSGWEWVAVEGDADLAGPDDFLEGLNSGAVSRLIREIYAAAAGGTPDDWAELDEVIGAERHTAVWFARHGSIRTPLDHTRWGDFARHARVYDSGAVANAAAHRNEQNQ